MGQNRLHSCIGSKVLINKYHLPLPCQLGVKTQIFIAEGTDYHVPIKLRLLELTGPTITMYEINKCPSAFLEFHQAFLPVLCINKSISYLPMVVRTNYPFHCSHYLPVDLQAWRIQNYQLEIIALDKVISKTGLPIPNIVEAGNEFHYFSHISLGNLILLIYFNQSNVSHTSGTDKHMSSIKPDS